MLSFTHRLLKNVQVQGGRRAMSEGVLMYVDAKSIIEAHTAIFGPGIKIRPETGFPRSRE